MRSDELKGTKIKEPRKNFSWPQEMDNIHIALKVL
jgi:hypothetical protein